MDERSQYINDALIRIYSDISYGLKKKSCAKAGLTT